MDSPRSKSLIDAYFAQLDAQLAGMPEAPRRELEQELRQHLAALVAAHEELGRTPEDATAAALARFGDPVRIGRRLARVSQRAGFCGRFADPRARWVRAASLIGIYAAAWTFGGMLKTGGAFPASLREAPWGAFIGLMMWFAERFAAQKYHRSRTDAGTEP
jgi:hypothetical protein